MKIRFCVALCGLSVLSFATDPAPLDWSTSIDAMREDVVEAISANIPAIMAIFGLMVAVSVVFWLIKKVTSRD